LIADVDNKKWRRKHDMTDRVRLVKRKSAGPFKDGGAD